jgi:curved DNA-binding protein CbpA
MPIGPAEAFVLSHVNGNTDESEIADEAGIAPESVSATLEELARLGAIRFDESARPESSRTRPVHRVSGSMRIGPIVEAISQAKPQHPAAALYDPRELEEDVEIPAERRRVILDAFYRLDSVTHYQLLHVEPTADKRAIKNAYFEVVNVFHPDRYFGKRLGSYKPKLERLFARLTEAHDALTRAAPRAEYDAYLASLNKTRALDQQGAALEAQVQAIQRQIEDEARAAEALLAQASLLPPSPQGRSQSPIPEPGSSPRASGTATPGQSFGSQSRLPSQRPPDAEARKRALARKLGGRQLSGSMPEVLPSTPPASDRAEARARAAEELKRRYEQRVRRARDDRAERYLVNARLSLANKDPISAANALRIAASLVPENQEMTARLQDAQNEAEALLSDHYLAQAQYEEREGRMAEAARSYARATAGSPNARTFERAAYCMLMAQGNADLRLAAEHARRAVAVGPDDVQSRVTLARIYVTAGMKQSGLAEFERAATLAPKDDTIRDWIQRLKRGEA